MPKSIGNLNTAPSSLMTAWQRQRGTAHNTRLIFRGVANTLELALLRAVLSDQACATRSSAQTRVFLRPDLAAFLHAMACSCSYSSATADRSSLYGRPGVRPGQRQLRRVAVRAGLLDTLIKPITSSGEVCPVGQSIQGAAPVVAVRQGLLPVAAVAAAPPACRGACPTYNLLCFCRLRPQRKPLKEGIANFYDESSQLWESIWVGTAPLLRIV